MPETRAAVRRRRLGVLAVLVLVAASAYLLQPFGYNQYSHLALVHALADGNPSVDRYADYSGDESFYHGHFYSNKAPGLAFVSLPAFVTLRALGLPDGVHALTLFGVLLPAALLLLLVRNMAERVEPGLGTAAAVTLGAATLVLPFTGLYFAHVLSALLGFAAFFVLWREREGPERLRLVAAGGLLAGLAVVVEYPLVLVAGVLGLYALARPRLVRRGLAYAGGVLLGVAPLLAFDWWAFRNPFHLSYGDVTARHAPRSYGLDLPSPRAAVELLLSSRGLLALTPVVAAGAAATVVLYRRGKRAEALAIAAVGVAFLVYDSSFWGEFGGWGPGPRYLIPALPFLAVPLALAWRRLPLLTGALAAVSAATMLTAKTTEPLLPNDPRVGSHGDVVDTGRWAHHLAHGEFGRSLGSAAGLGRGWLSIAPFVLAIAAALALAAAATGRLPVRRRDAEAAAVALAGWALVLHAAPALLRHDRFEGGTLGVVAAALLAALAVLAVVRAVRAGPRAALPALPLAAFVARPLATHPAWALAVTLVALAAFALAGAGRWIPQRLPRASGVRP